MSVSSVVPASTLAMPTDFTATLSPDALMVYLTTRLNGLDDQINTIFNTEKQQQRVQSALRGLQSAVSELDPNATEGTAMDSAKVQDIQDALQALKNVDPALGAKVEQDLMRDGFLLKDDAATAPPPDSANTSATPPGPPVNERPPPDPNGTNGAPTGFGDLNPIWQGANVTPPADGTASGSQGPADPGPASTPTNTQFSGIEVKATTNYLDGISKDIENESQMNMIHLQSLMSARQTAIQLATNMISALGESSKAIAANIGR